MIAALEHVIANYGGSVTLHATTPESDFVASPAWYDLEPDKAHQASASRILLRSEADTPEFVSNIAVQLFSFEISHAIKLGDLDTTLDILALPEATVLSHDVGRDGYLCTDEGAYTTDDLDLRVRRSQVAFNTVDGRSALSVFTGTTLTKHWDDVAKEILEMEERWLMKAAPTNGAK